MQVHVHTSIMYHTLVSCITHHKYFNIYFSKIKTIQDISSCKLRCIRAFFKKYVLKNITKFIIIIIIMLGTDCDFIDLLAAA